MLVEYAGPTSDVAATFVGGDTQDILQIVSLANQLLIFAPSSYAAVMDPTVLNAQHTIAFIVTWQRVDDGNGRCVGLLSTKTETYLLPLWTLFELTDEMTLLAGTAEVCGSNFAAHLEGVALGD